jgi:hypothetical protein
MPTNSEQLQLKECIELLKSEYQVYLPPRAAVGAATFINALTATLRSVRDSKRILAETEKAKGRMPKNLKGQSAGLPPPPPFQIPTGAQFSLDGKAAKPGPAKPGAQSRPR